jgi:curved DNA-binding protein CbpA
MSLSEARSVLGLGADASREDILEAHARLIRRTHPDAGGTDGLAAHLTAARDRLLGG